MCRTPNSRAQRRAHRELSCLLLVALVACSDDAPARETVELAADASPSEPVTRGDAGAGLDGAAGSASEHARDGATSEGLHDAAASSARDAAIEQARRDAAVVQGTRDGSTPRDAAAPPATSPRPDAGGKPDAAVAPPVDCDEQLGYDSFGKPFMDSYCLGCHGFKNEPLFTTLPRIAVFKDEIVERVLYETVDALHMPPFGRPQPSVSEQKKLERWLLCGPK